MKKPKKLTRIKEEWAMSIIREEYQKAKRELYPLLNNWHFSSIRWSWGERMKSYGGWCAYSYWRKQIALTSNYRERHNEEGIARTPDTWSEEQMRMTVRHEICHLIEHNHGPKFLRYLELLGGHRYVGRPAYEKPNNKSI